jgi:hypothetical protein
MQQRKKRQVNAPVGSSECQFLEQVVDGSPRRHDGTGRPLDLPLDHCADFVGQGFYREGFGDHFHAWFEKTMGQGGVFGVAGHEQDFQVGAGEAGGVG